MKKLTKIFQQNEHGIIFFKWNKRKYGFKIGCLYYEIQLSCGKFYSRMLLMVVERAKNYNIIKTYNRVLYNTLKDACSARGLSNNNDG